MSYTPAYGWGNNPIRMYNSDNPVVMSRPFVSGTAVQTGGSNAYFSNGTLSAVIAPVAVGEFSWYGDIILCITNPNFTTLSFSYSYGTDCSHLESPPTGYALGEAAIKCNGVRVGSPISFDEDNLTGNLTIPYYRYRLYLALWGSCYYSINDAWIRLDWTNT